MIISYQELKTLYGASSPADLAARLDQANVRYLFGKRNQPFTTEFALNSAMGLISRNNGPEKRPAIEIG